MKKFSTLENMCTARESDIAQVLHLRAPEASEILLAAKQRLAERNRKKQVALKSLKSAGTTPQNAADIQYTKDLAAGALEAADDDRDFTE
jgi:excinuclease ABC subunit C